MHWVAGRKSHKGVCFFFPLVGVLQDGTVAMMTVELVEEMEGIQTEETSRIRGPWRFLQPQLAAVNLDSLMADIILLFTSRSSPVEKTTFYIYLEPNWPLFLEGQASKNKAFFFWNQVKGIYFSVTIF